VTRHGASRFDIWLDPAVHDAQQAPADGSLPPAERFRTQNRAGWRRWERSERGPATWRYYVTSSGMKEALAGLPFRESLKTLADLGYIVKPGGYSEQRNTLSRVHYLPGHGDARLYELRPGILASDGDA